jgi:hypothetical protein
MPYFFILPAYLVLLLILSLIAGLVRLLPRLRWASGYLAGGIIGTIPGFIGANILVTISAFLPVWVSQKASFSQGVVETARIFTFAVLFIGPFLASVIGTGFGFAAGLFFVMVRRRARRSAGALAGDKIPGCGTGEMG